MTAPTRTLISLEQFAALESWIEAFVRMQLAEHSAGPGRSERITKSYQARMRAMQLLTGATPPGSTSAPPADDECDLA